EREPTVAAAPRRGSGLQVRELLQSRLRIRTERQQPDDRLHREASVPPRAGDRRDRPIPVGLDPRHRTLAHGPRELAARRHALEHAVWARELLQLADETAQPVA